jgi:hypothetical protein
MERRSKGSNSVFRVSSFRFFIMLSYLFLIYLTTLRVLHVEAGSNTSTAVLRFVGGVEKGSLEFETVKYDHEPH